MAALAGAAADRRKAPAKVRRKLASFQDKIAFCETLLVFAIAKSASRKSSSRQRKTTAGTNQNLVLERNPNAGFLCHQHPRPWALACSRDVPVTALAGAAAAKVGFFFGNHILIFCGAVAKLTYLFGA